MFVASNAELVLQPVGPAGPTITVEPGFSLLHRTCTQGTPNRFERVPFETTLSFDAAAAGSSQSGRDPYADACALPLEYDVNLGDSVAALPADQSFYPYRVLPVTDLAWTPASDAVYFLAGALGSASVELFRAGIGQMGIVQIMFGQLYGPLEMATGGTSLLFNQAGLESGPEGQLSMAWSRRVRQSLVPGAVSPQIQLPILTTWPPREWAPRGGGARVYDVLTTELVGADRVAPPATLTAAVVATDQVFAWALQCFGLGETSCNAELRRLSLATGARDVVARAGAALPFAVSPDGSKIALADARSLYIKTIQP